MADHDFMLKIFSSYPAPGTSNEGHKTPVKVVAPRTEFLNARPQDYEAEVLTTRTPPSVK
jgi:hypothetical protein